MSGGISITYTTRLDERYVMVSGGGADEVKREELLSRGARLHEGMRLIKGLGRKIKTNVEILFFECLKMVA